jgi:hypothetical protein
VVKPIGQQRCTPVRRPMLSFEQGCQKRRVKQSEDRDQAGRDHQRRQRSNALPGQDLLAAVTAPRRIGQRRRRRQDGGGQANTEH